MSEAVEEEPKKKGGGKLLLILSLVLALAGAGGGFFAVSSGLFGSGEEKAAEADLPEVPLGSAFIPLDPIIVSLGSAAANRHLSFRAQLEVPTAHAGEVQAILPRLVDVLNSYLRAVDVREFDEPAGLIRLRAQMLRRLQLIAGEGRVSDLLVMEFVLN